MVGRLDRWEALLERQLAAAPYVLLVISTVLALLAGSRPWLTVGLAVLAAAWLWLVPRGAVYVTGLVALIGALCTQGCGSPASSASPDTSTPGTT
ncbi:hypothetical protein ACFQ0B_14780 [Nonomuraea thailandensis]